MAEAETDARRRLTAFAEQERQRARELRERAQRLSERNRIADATERRARAEQAERTAGDIAALLSSTEASVCDAAPVEARAPETSAEADGAESAALIASLRQQLAAVAEAAGNAVAHLRRVAPAADPATLHANALGAFEWLAREASRPLPEPAGADAPPPQVVEPQTQDA